MHKALAGRQPDRDGVLVDGTVAHAARGMHKAVAACQSNRDDLLVRSTDAHPTWPTLQTADPPTHLNIDTQKAMAGRKLTRQTTQLHVGNRP